MHVFAMALRVPGDQERQPAAPACRGLVQDEAVVVGEEGSAFGGIGKGGEPDRQDLSRPRLLDGLRRKPRQFSIGDAAIRGEAKHSGRDSSDRGAIFDEHRQQASERSPNIKADWVIRASPAR